MESGSGEAPPKKYSQGLDVKEFKAKQGLEKPKQSLLTKVLLGLGIAGVGAGAGAAIAPQIETATKSATSEIVEGAENIKRGGEKLVDNYNEDPAIRQKSEEVAGKLNGTIPLSEGEQIFEKVKIVPAGATFEERQKMEQDGTEINVRNFTGNTPRGEFGDIIGKLRQGTIIEHVISIKGGVPHPATANDTGDWWGFVYRPEGSDPNEPGKIGFVFGMYGTALAVGEAASSTPTPPQTPTNQ